MSDIININTGVSNQPERICQVAYTINNEQPVVCTIIGEQPLFYMYYSAEDHEDDLFDAAELSILEDELLKLEQNIKSLERLNTETMRGEEEIFETFDENKKSVESAARKNADVQALRDVLSKSRLAKAYMDAADEYGVTLHLSAQVAEGEYDRKSGTIQVNADLDLVDQVLVAAKELRRHWQHRQGALIHPMMFHPDSAVLINRVQNADLATSVVRIAWELQMADYKEAWARLETSSMADLGRAFAREAFLDFRTLNNGKASAAVFEAWFLSERCRGEDRALIQSMLADYQGYVFDLEESEKSITPALIAALGEMPFGKNYLSSHVHTIMEDAIFTDVRDRSNANFLWFIKFEKSFREAEQELQLEESKNADGIRQAALLKNKKNTTGTQYDQLSGSSAEIIQLFDDQNKRQPKSRKRAVSAQGGQGAEIIYLR